MLLIVFSRLFTRILPLVVALCVVVPAIGARSLSEDEAWEQFGFAYCTLPCFAGITPGKTPYHQAPGMLRQNIPVMENRMFNTGTTIDFWAVTQRQALAGIARLELGNVGELRLNTTIPLDHLLVQLGTPDCILMAPANNPGRAWVIFWVRQQVSIGAVLRAEPSLINLSGHVPALWLRSGDSNDCEQPAAVPWRGFAPMWAYAT